MGAQGESQWAAARGLFSTLTTSGIICFWGKSQSDVEKERFRYPRDVFAILAIGRWESSRLPRGVFAIPRFLRTFRGGTQNMSTQEDESHVPQHKDFCCYL